MVVVALIAVFLGGRASYLSFTGDARYLAFAAEQRPRSAEVAESIRQRGDVVSADGRKLATSVQTAAVIATPYQIEAPEKTARALASTIGSETGLSLEEIKDSLTRRDDEGRLGGYSVVASVEPETAERVRKLNLQGITTEKTALRTYPDGELASQLVGHVGDYGEAFGGVEARYDDALKSGQDIKLTVDGAVQQELESALQEAMRKNEAKSALGLVMRVDDGSIVALANEPGYDNNKFNQTSPEAQRDRVLTDPYEPGSTFKPFTIAAALEEGSITPESAFTVPDSIQVADRIIHDSVPHATETMVPADILQRSSNVGTIQIARILGGERLDAYIGRFGFGEKTGVDLWGEDPGMVPDYPEWSGSSIGNIPIGQGIAVTPLQLASGYATLANGGYRITPHVSEKSSKGPGERVISERTSSIVRGMLQSVVEEGTGRFARIPGYTVAGKTGTSQKVDPSTGTYGDEYVASFIGFAPAGKPEYLALIVVDEPQTTIWGESVAAPAFKKVMKFTLGYYNVPPDDSRGRKR